MRAKFRIKAINIKADMHFLREPAYNLIGNLLPRLAFILPALDILIEIGNDAIVTIDDLKLTTTVITDADLYKRF